jgi:hypothetical protein
MQKGQWSNIQQQPLLKQRESWTALSGSQYEHSVAGYFTKSSTQGNVGPLIKGNHRTPNQWFFDISRRRNGDLNAFYSLITQKDIDGNVIARVTDTYYGGPYQNLPEGLAIEGHTDRIEAVRGMAAANLLEKLRGGLDVSIDLAQAKKTAAIGTDIRNSVTKAVHAIRAAGMRKLTLPMKAAGNAWLLWMYGAKPTLQTLYDGLDTLAHRRHFHGAQKYFAKANLPYEKVVRANNWPDASFSQPGGYHTLKGNYRCRIDAWLDIPNDNLEQAARWTSLNPMSIAWELMPWSFVADWFFNVGDYLRNTESHYVYGRFWKGGWRTTSYKIEVQSGPVFRTGGDVEGSVWTGSYASQGIDIMSNREQLLTLPGVPSPRFKPELGSGRLLNAAALLTTFLRR